MSTVAEHDEDLRVLYSAVGQDNLDPLAAALELLRRYGADTTTTSRTPS